MTEVSKLHGELFHYTSMDAFESIYKSQTFWATHYTNLNDSSEFQIFRRKLEEFIRPDIRRILVERGYGADDIDSKVEQVVAIHLDDLHHRTFGECGLQEVFISSFCTHEKESVAARHGLLSQWRGYGAGGGVAIVLDTRGIEEQMAHEQYIFDHSESYMGNVLYDDNDTQIREDRHLVFKHLPQLIRSFYPEFAKESDLSLDTWGLVLSQFIYGTTLVKHHGFCEEQEVRIVVSPRPTNPKSIFYVAADIKPSKEILYRMKDDREVRYIKLFGIAPLPIRRVIIGPSRFQNLNHQKITEQVKGTGIEVVKSEIPFIG
ncbi:MAG: DUF2971 domain-containing protein [Gallionella sp.]